MDVADFNTCKSIIILNKALVFSDIIFTDERCIPNSDTFKKFTILNKTFLFIKLGTG